MIQFLMEHYDEMLEIAGTVIGLASMITAITPTPNDDAIVHKISDWFSILKPHNADGTLKLPFTLTKKE